MLHHLLILVHFELLDESQWVSLHDVCFGSGYGSLLARLIEAVSAATLIRLAKDALGEALAVELQALGAGTMACVGQHHWFQH